MIHTRITEAQGRRKGFLRLCFLMRAIVVNCQKTSQKMSGTEQRGVCAGGKKPTARSINRILKLFESFKIRTAGRKYFFDTLKPGRSILRPGLQHRFMRPRMLREPDPRGLSGNNAVIGNVLRRHSPCAHLYTPPTAPARASEGRFVTLPGKPAPAGRKPPPGDRPVPRRSPRSC